MKALPRTYLLSPILHKDNYELADGVVIAIDKSFENNLRERNPQLGCVEAVPDDNWLKLNIGDTVAVNHFTFFGDIGTNRGFDLKAHVVHNDKMLFPVVERQMFFKYNNILEVLPGYLICDYVDEPEEHFGVYFGERNYIRCTHGRWAGSELLVLENAMYLITLGKESFYKVREDEVAAVDGIPVDGWIEIEYLPEVEGVLYGVKKPNNVRALCSDGRILQVYRNQGVKHGDKWLINEEMIIGEWIDQI